jgi:hypothetical protein
VWRVAGADVAGDWASRWQRGVALAVAAALAFSLAVSIGPLDSTPRAVAANPAATVIARYRAHIPELMAEQGIPSLAVALVDADRTLWVEGFGHVDRRGSAPVTADTIFSVQSMSKHGDSGDAGRCGWAPGPRRAAVRALDMDEVRTQVAQAATPSA